MSRMIEVLDRVDVMRDLAPHLFEDYAGRLWWVGPMDRRNNAPIAETPDGLRIPVLSTLGILYEISLRPHVLAGTIVELFTTPNGGLMKFGSKAAIPCELVDPRNRRFGTLSSGGLDSWMPLPGSGSKRRRTRRLVRELAKAADRWREESK